VTLTSKLACGIDSFSLWLVRLPTVDPPDPESLSFEDFSVSDNAISFLSLFPYEPVPQPKVKLPKRSKEHRYDDETPMKKRRRIPEKY